MFLLVPVVPLYGFVPVWADKGTQRVATDDGSRMVISWKMTQHCQQSAVNRAPRVCPNVHFCTKCTARILTYAVLTAYLSGGANSAPIGLLYVGWSRV